jgi:hypothetical protein
MTRRADEPPVPIDTSADREAATGRWPWLALALLTAAFVLIYLPDVGHGFVKDDFVWIARSRIGQLSDLETLLRAPRGFFRPLVSVSFAANYALCGVAPLCYGVTNLALSLACAVAIAGLAASVGLPRGAAVAAGAIWAFNVHGIDMATLWISGRTSLLLTLLAAGAASAFAREHYRWAAVLALAAMGSKEEAVALPAVLIGWAVLTRSNQPDRAPSPEYGRGPDPVAARAQGAVLLVLAGVVYAGVRAFSGAFTPGTAPQFYRLGFTPQRVVSNVLPYANRSMTVALSACVLFWILARPSSIRLTRTEHQAAGLGLLWAIGGFALTIFLPVRSSLYACLPSAGVAIAAAAWLSAAWRTSDRAGRTRAAVAGLILPFVLWWPVYRVRNARLVQEAELSSRTLAAIAALRESAPGGLTVLLKDDRRARPALDSAFATLAQDAVDLIVGPGVRVAMDPPPTNALFADPDPVTAPDAVLELRDGSLVRIR